MDIIEILRLFHINPNKFHRIVVTLLPYHNWLSFEKSSRRFIDLYLEVIDLPRGHTVLLSEAGVID